MAFCVFAPSFASAQDDDLQNKTMEVISTIKPKISDASKIEVQPDKDENEKINRSRNC